MESIKSFSIYNYTNYRNYLRDYYLLQKQRNPVFSYRYFAKKAGFNSSGLYKDIVNGRTGITRSLIFRFAAAMNLSKKQTEYFETLVYFNEAKNIEEKRSYFDRLKRFYNSKASKVDATQYEYYSKWYYAAIRELFSTGDFKDNYSLIARSLNPKIRPEHAKKAVEVLLRLGLTVTDDNGFYRSAEKVITTGKEVRSLAIATFQRAMMDLAKEAIDRHPSGHRNISSVTFSVSEETYNEIKAELDTCRKRILNMIENCTGEDRVCQLNMQLFPLTHLSEKTHREN